MLYYSIFLLCLVLEFVASNERREICEGLHDYILWIMDRFDFIIIFWVMIMLYFFISVYWFLIYFIMASIYMQKQCEQTCCIFKLDCTTSYVKGLFQNLPHHPYIFCKLSGYTSHVVGVIILSKVTSSHHISMIDAD